MINIISILLSVINVLAVTKIIFVKATNLNWSIVTIILLICFFFINKSFFNNIKKWRNAYFIVFSMMFSSMIFSGYWITNGFSINALGVCIYIICSVAYFPIIYTLFYNFYLWMIKRLQTWRTRTSEKRISNLKMGAFIFSCMFICWFIVLMAYYPGIFGYDAVYEALEVQSNEYITHHPIIHTLMVGIFYLLGERVLTYNLGIFLYSLTQIIILDGIITYSLIYLYKRNISYNVILILMLYYAIFPAVNLIALDTTKDVLYSGFMLLFIVSLNKLYENQYKIISRKGICCCIQIIISGWLMCAFRNNGIHALWVTLILTIFYFWKDKKWKNTATIIYLIIALLYIGSNHYILDRVNAYISSPREAMGIPFQQICRVYVNHYDELEPEMIQRIEEVLPDAKNYKYNLSDPIKANAVVRDRVGDIMGIWSELLLRYPFTYIEAFLYANTGMWFIDDVSYSYVYVFDEEGVGSAIITGYEAGYGVEMKSKIPFIQKALNELVKTDYYQNIPIISILFCPAIYFWLVLYFIVINCHNHNKLLASTGFILLGYHFTTLFGPCALLRYAYPLIICAPFIVVLSLITLSGFRNNQKS